MSFPKQQQKPPGTQSEMNPVPDCGEESYRGGSGRLAGKRAVITGGDSGIGRAVAIAYAREGADVLIAYLNEDGDAKKVAGYVEQAGRRCVLVPGDLSDPAHCRTVIDRAVDELGGIDILVNNAAYQMTHESLEDITDEEWDYTFRVNIGAYFHLAKAALAHLKPGGRDHRQFVGELRYALADAGALRGHQGRDRELLGKPGTVVGREGHSRQQCGAGGPIWTPLIPATMPPEKVESFGENTPPRTGGSARRAGTDLRPAGVRRRQLHLRRPGSCHRRPARAVAPATAPGGVKKSRLPAISLPWLLLVSLVR